jgi:AcrR family transcriptional regulator
MAVTRIDARRNRDDILTVAERIFRERGTHVALDLIAQGAGIGRATLYRHFPDREALLMALLSRGLDRFEAEARINEGSDALFLMLAHYAEKASERSTLSEYWRNISRDHPEIVAADQRLRTITEPLILRAIEAGLCAPDLTAGDVLAFFQMIGGAVRGAAPAERKKEARRALGWILRGIRLR